MIKSEPMAEQRDEKALMCCTKECKMKVTNTWYEGLMAEQRDEKALMCCTKECKMKVTNTMV